MFSVILRPIVDAIRTYMGDAAYKAAREGAKEGLQRFADEFASGVEIVPKLDGKPQAIPIMASAAQVTTAPDDREAKFAHAKSLVDGGMSLRKAAEESGFPYSTLQERLSKGGGS